jgi:Holin of 3TMs, for gene-transfer release
MSFDPLTSALDLGARLVDRLIPDPAAKAQAALQPMQLQSSGELARMTAGSELARAQVEVNKAEATSSSLFVAGGRPFVIWVCGAALANDFIIRPLALFVAGLLGGHTGWPALDAQSLMPLLLGLLGLGALRTYEKVQA